MHTYIIYIDRDRDRYSLDIPTLISPASAKIRKCWSHWTVASGGWA